MSDVESDIEEAVGATSVLLGYAGREASLGDISIQGNHIGGSPVWLCGRSPSKELVQCKVCDKELDLLAQLSCPLPTKDYDRVLYIFSCSDPNCRRKKGSVRALRGIMSNDEVRERIKKEINDSKPENNIGPSHGDIGDRIFISSGASASESNPFASANPFSSGAPTPMPASASTASKKTNKKARSKRDNIIVPGKYACKLVEVEEEFIEPENTKEYSDMKIEEAEEGQDDEAEIKEIKEVEAKQDPVFSKFVTMVEHNPEQILRYERGLTPLLYNGDDGIGKELADIDTRGKVLEVQLMPHLITELETEDMLVDGMEWGTIFVATAADDTLSELDDAGVGYTEEYVAVQWEG